MRHELTPEQARELAEIEVRRRAVQAEWERALRLVGLDPAKVTGGELVKDPHLMVAE